MTTTEKLGLSATGGEKSPSTGGKAKKTKKISKTFAAAKAKVGDSRKDTGKLNPPKYKDVSGGKYVGKNLAEFFDTNDLRMRDFRDCDLSGASFRGCNIQGCLFKGAKIDHETDFAGADARWANFNGAEWPEGGLESVKWGDENEDGVAHNLANLFECDGVMR